MLLILNLLTVRYDFILLSIFSIKAKIIMLLVKLKYFTLRLYTYLYVCIIIYLVNDKNNNLFDVGSLESEK